MGALIQFFNIVLYQPLLNALILLYTYLPGHDFGIAVIVLTLIMKLILHPSSLHAIRSQKALSTLQPKIKEIQRKYKNNKQEQARATMELYKKEKISPFSGCLPLLLQLPILIALYQVFLKGLKPEVLTASLYSFVPNPGEVIPTFLGIVNLAQPNFLLALTAGILQFFQSKISFQKPRGEQKSKKGDFSSMMQNQMLYFFPIFTVFIVWKLGSIIGLYWIVSTLFSIGEQFLVNKKYVK
ncbi:membrane protein insertase YidC [Patescibacteria group bacterium]|nr:membrane protein insertase YidC [Patescibacteria group bacterium]